MTQTTIPTEAANAARELGQALAEKVRELKEFFDLMSEQIANGLAPAPSCDAPHCDCATGEDCHANGAADQQVGDCECHSGADCETPEICAHERNEATTKTIVGMDFASKDGPFSSAVTLCDGRVIPAAEVVKAIGRLGAEIRGSVLGISSKHWGYELNDDDWCLVLDALEAKRRAVVEDELRTVVALIDNGDGTTTPVRAPATRQVQAILPDLAARLDGLKATVDALAERLERGPDGYAKPVHAMDREVRTAVMALQKALRIREDGRVGPVTMAAIEGIQSWSKEA